MSRKLTLACRQQYGEDFPVYLCHWHVKRAWLQNLLAKCDRGMPKAVFERLGQIMAMLKHHDESDAAFLARVKQCMEQLYTEFAAHTSCIEYLQRQWASDVKLSKSYMHHKTQSGGCAVMCISAHQTILLLL